MQWLTALRRFFNTTASHPESWFVEWVRGGAETDSGVCVNGRTAMMWAPMWYGVNKICGHMGQLPIDLCEKTSADVSRKLDSHPSHWLMNFQPNEMMAPSVFREVIQHHAILWGNGRAAIYRNDRREPDELIPLLPDRTHTVIVNKEKWHIHRNVETGEITKIRDNDVVHICGFGYDGIEGYSLIDFARNSIGLGLAGEKHINAHFKNNAAPSLVLESPPGMFRDENEAKDFLRNWNAYYQGVDNANKVGLLREGMKATPLAGMSGKDAEWLQERVFQRQEAALWLLLESILGDDSSVSYNSLEQKNLGYLVNCLMRWIVKWEEELARKLLTRTQFETGRYYWKFKTAALLRGTTKERYDVYAIAIQNRILNPNECRAMEDKPPYDGGDEYQNPATTPGAPPGDQPATDTPPKEDPQTTQRLTYATESAIKARLDVLAKVERQRIREAAAKHANRFVQWIDEFYGEFSTRLEQAVESLGGDRKRATEWVDKSKAWLLTCAGESTRETLVRNVDRELELWSRRTERLAKDLTEELTCAES